MKKLIFVPILALALTACGGHKYQPQNNSQSVPAPAPAPSNPPKSDLDPILSDANCAIRLRNPVVYSTRKLPKGTDEHFSVLIRAGKNGGYIFQARRVTDISSRYSEPVRQTTFYYVESGWYESNRTLVLSQGARTIGYIEILQMTPTPIVVLDVTDPDYLKAGLPLFVGLSVSSCEPK